MMGFVKIVTAQIYCKQLDRLNEVLHKKRSVMLKRRNIVLHHDNARRHVVELTHLDGSQYFNLTIHRTSHHLITICFNPWNIFCKKKITSIMR